jgi:hypothetical protein
MGNGYARGHARLALDLVRETGAAAEDLRRAGRLMARDACAVVLAGAESRRFGSDRRWR